MNSLHVRRLLPTMVLTFLIAPCAHSADLTLFVGGVKPGKLSRSGIITALDSSPIFGARLSTNFVPFFGMEHTLAFSSDYLFPRGIESVTQAKGFVYSSNLIVNIPIGKTVPYATAGIGLIHQYGSRDLPLGTSFAVNYGGGLKIPKLVGPLGLRFDARGYTVPRVFSTKLNILEISAGILLGF